MQGFGALLLDRCAAELTPENADYLRRITRAADRLDALICDSLQYAKVVREKIPLTSVEPSLVLRGILESYPTLQSTQAEIQILEPLPPVLANKAGLAQCFSNLLSNAIKFVKPGQVPQIRIWAEEVARSEVGSVTPCAPPISAPAREGQGDVVAAIPPAAAALSAGGEGRHEVPPSIQQPSTPPPTAWVRFWFEDKGIGIPAKYQDRIFDMFQQLDKSYEGTGIGLALVRKTADRMGGKVGVESEPGKGSRFWLEFKAAT
jgi:signal transduction histidine kinase